MSESSGGQTVREMALSSDVVVVRLLFQSRPFDLESLAARIKEVEALVSFLLAPGLIINAAPIVSPDNYGISIPRKRRFPSFHGKARTRAMKADRWPLRAVTATTQEVRSLTQAKILVERVSLNSPLEIIMTISASAAALGGVVALLPKMIDVKNKWNDSRVQRANSNLRVERLELERRINRMISDEIGDINLAAYFVLPDDHPSKQIVKRSIHVISTLNEAEAQEK